VCLPFASVIKIIKKPGQRAPLVKKMLNISQISVEMATLSCNGLFNPFCLEFHYSIMGTVTTGFDTRLANRPCLVLDAPEYPKVKNYK